LCDVHVAHAGAIATWTVQLDLSGDGHPDIVDSGTIYLNNGSGPKRCPSIHHAALGDKSVCHRLHRKCDFTRRLPSIFLERQISLT
jgi:hypothetical protein